MRLITITLIFFYSFNTKISCKEIPESISLAGEWEFAIDSSDFGIQNNWFNRKLDDLIILPGSMNEQGKGYPPSLKTLWTGSIYDSSWYFNPAMEKYRLPGNLKFPFWLTPEKYYTGAAWYQKEIIIPDAWKNKIIILYLERPHWETTLWINNKMIGTQNSLSTPHKYDITKYTLPGKNRITIKIDNRIKEINVGPDSHSITDHTQGNWNGVTGKIELQSLPKVNIEKIKIIPDIRRKSARIQLKLINYSGKPVKGKIQASAESFNTGKQHIVPLNIQKFSIDSLYTELTFDYEIGDSCLLWNEFNPSLYRLALKLITTKGNEHDTSAVFGMREFKIDGTTFTVNGNKVFLRGNVDCAAFPLTGYPPTDVDSWERIFKKAKEYGLNHMRYHSWCPPEAAFIAADKMGFYLQPEGPSWANHGTTIGDNKPIDKYLFEECEKIIDTYGNHPSFCMMAYGNEPAGKNQVDYLTKWVNYFRSYDSTKVYTGASIGRSWPVVPANDFIVRSEPRGLPWDRQPQTEFDYREKIEPYDKPYIAHEMGQYCVYPNFDEIKKYTGVYKARNFELFKEELENNSMGKLAKNFLMASGKLQSICYKSEIEAAFRTPGFAGFQLLGLNDFPGQGSAIIGVLDVFWDDKGYITGKEFSQFCNQTVILSRMKKFVYTNNEFLDCQIEVAHYGTDELHDRQISWAILDNNKPIKEGKFPATNIKPGTITAIGNINVLLDNIKNASGLKIKVIMDDTENQWDLWVYPEDLPVLDTSDIYICSMLDSTVMTVLNNGGKVFLHAAGKVENGREIVQHFTPVFWNTSWFKMRPPHTTGILCDPNHPALQDFPTEYHSNLQWWEILHNQQVMNLDLFPADFKPVIQPIDTWFLNRRLGLVFEAKLGNGRIIVCSADLISDPENRPVARQLYYSLLNYMNSDLFVPEIKINFNILAELFEKKERNIINFYTKDSPDELKPKLKL